MTKQLFTSLFFSLSYDDTHKWLQAEWQGTHDTVSSLASCAVIMQHAKEQHCYRLLCDSSLAYDGWDEISHWVSTNYLPRLAEIGITHISWILARNWVASASVIHFIQESTVPQIMMFNEGIDAYDWLAQQPIPRSRPE